MEFSGVDHDMSMPQTLKSAFDNVVDLEVRKHDGGYSGSDLGEDFEEKQVDVLFINYSSDLAEKREQLEIMSANMFSSKKSMHNNDDEVIMWMEMEKGLLILLTVIPEPLMHLL